MPQSDVSKSTRPPKAAAGCDTMVALASASKDGSVIFAKNSDRPADESQPLFQMPRMLHPPGVNAPCQYIEIPQAGETYGLIGSRPHWLWGFEHGVNEYGVAIGNEAVFSKQTLPESGLLGMDLVRLGLERGKTAREALEVITVLLERHGQGGSAYEHVSWSYDNSFLIADPEKAYILETSGREYAWKQVDEIASISNHIAIGEDWSELSRDARNRAIQNGWWSADTDGRFNFSGAYRSTEVAPPQISEERLRQSGMMLEEFRGRIEPQTMMRILRDHYDSGTIFTSGREPGDGKCYSICMHADPVGTTAASVVAHIQKSYPFVTYWASFANPCCGVFMPLYLQAPLPPALMRAGSEFSEDSAWWLFKKLGESVAVDYVSRTPAVQAAWAELEIEFAEKAAYRNAEAASLYEERRSGEAGALLEELMRENMERVLLRLRRLLVELK